MGRGVRTADARDKEGLEADGSAQLDQIGKQKGTVLDEICHSVGLRLLISNCFQSIEINLTLSSYQNKPLNP